MAFSPIDWLLIFGQMIVFLFSDWAVILPILFLLVQTVGYVLLIAAAASLHQNKDPSQSMSLSEKQPSFSFIIPAYNEENNIEKKLENTFGLRYPRDLLEVIVVDDGSTDRTPEILKRLEVRYSPNLKVLAQNRKGKSAADDLGLKNAGGEIAVVSDTDTFLNAEALSYAVEDFADPSVGGVTSHVRSTSEEGKIEVISLNQKIGFYLRSKENDLGLVSGMSGPFAAFRKNLISHFDSGVYACDMDIALLVRKSGSRVIYDKRIVGSTRPHGRDFKNLVRYVKHTFKGDISMFLRHHDLLYSRKQSLLSKVVALQYLVLPLLAPFMFAFLMAYTFLKMLFSPYILPFYGAILLFLMVYLVAKRIASSSVISKIFDLILVRVITYLACLYVYLDYFKDRSGIWDTV